MDANLSTVALRNSARRKTLSTAVIGAPSPQLRVAVLLHLRRRAPLPSVDALGDEPVRRRTLVTREAFDDLYGAAPDDLAAVEKIVAGFALQVHDVDLGRRLLRVSGQVADVERCFGVQIAWFQHPSGIILSHLGAVSVPAPMADVVEAVYGLDTRPVVTPQIRTLRADRLDPWLRLQQHAAYGLEASRLAQTMLWRQAVDHEQALVDLHAGAARATAAPSHARQVLGQYAQTSAMRGEDLVRQMFAAYVSSLGLKIPTQAASLYDFPSHLDGSGQCIGVLQFGGGFDPSSVMTYFALLGPQAPAIKVVSVGGAANQPGVNDLFDTEVALDIEIAGGAAPGATVVVYFAPVTEAGFIEAFATAIHDKVNRPSVLSLSWALAEQEFLTSPVFVTQLNELFKEAALLGVTICVASGDHGFLGSTLGPSLGPGVDFPGSSPYVLACGGTTLVTSGGRTLAETVWNDLLIGEGASGGGISAFFPLPSYQGSAGVPPSIVPGQGPGRGVPDVCANGNPITGYYISVHGRPAIAAGTSSAAPLWAALIARLNQGLGVPCGFLNPILYRGAADACRDVTVGDNGGYRAVPGWDACTGLGSPSGAALLERLEKS